MPNHSPPNHQSLHYLVGSAGGYKFKKMTDYTFRVYKSSMD